MIWPWNLSFRLEYPKSWSVDIQRKVLSLWWWINCQTSLYLQLRGPLPSESRVPEVMVLCGTPEIVEMLNFKWLVQFCAESDLIAQIQARSADVSLRNIYRRKLELRKAIYTYHFSDYLLMGKKSGNLLSVKAKVCCPGCCSSVAWSILP